MKTYNIIGWLDDNYGKWNVEAENDDEMCECDNPCKVERL